MLGTLIWAMVGIVYMIIRMVAERDFFISERGGVVVFWTVMTVLVTTAIGIIVVIQWFWHNPDCRITKRVITGPDDPMINGLSESDRRTIIQKTADEIAILRFFRKKELEAPTDRFLRDTQKLIEEKEGVLRAVGVEDIGAEIRQPMVSFEALSKDEKADKAIALLDAERWFQPILFG